MECWKGGKVECPESSALHLRGLGAGLERSAPDTEKGPAGKPTLKSKTRNQTKIMSQNNVTDLTQHPPRSARVRLGGYAILPRMLDKGRATIAGKHGEYKYACPLDERFLDFAGIDPAALKKQLAAGKGDGEILAWIEKNAKHKRTDPELADWVEFAEQLVVNGPSSFNKLHRHPILRHSTWFDLLDGRLCELRRESVKNDE